MLSKNKNKNIIITNLSNKLIIENKSDKLQKTNVLKFLFFKKGLYNFNFEGKVLKGNIPKLKVISKTKKNIIEIKINECQLKTFLNKKIGFVILQLPPKTKFIVTNIIINIVENNDYIIQKLIKEDLVIFNKTISMSFLDYFLQFKNQFDMICVNDINEFNYCNIKGLNILNIKYYFLREILYQKNYKKIIIIGFDIELVRSINKLDLHKSKIFLLINEELEYWDFPKMIKMYNCNMQTLSQNYIKDYNYLDKNIEKFNKMSNYKFIFNDIQTKKRAENLLKFKFNNFDYFYPYIYNLNIDKFSLLKKSINKILIIKTFDYFDINAFDLDLKLIKDLEKFYNLEITIVGDGNCFDILVEPLKNKKNIILIRDKISNAEKYLKGMDVLIFNTRGNVNNELLFLSTLKNVFVTGIVKGNDSINDYFFPNYKKFYNNLIKIINDDEEFFIQKKENYLKCKRFIEKDKVGKDCFVNNKDYYPTIKRNSNENPILSILIPSYNVQKFVRHTIWSLINHELVSKLEIIAVNDGSTDETLQVLRNCEMEMKKNGDVILKIIDKPNGGHGSVINVGLKNVTGKYVRLVDGDDTVDSENMKKLIEKLETENCDLVLNQYNEDKFNENLEVDIPLYNNLKGGKKYNFNEICLKKDVFNIYGPLLPTSSYKTSSLKKRSFLITEKIFYDDMEWNYNAILNTETISFYNLNVYNHFIGRVGQSVTTDGIKKHYQMHRIMTCNLINLYLNNQNINKNKLKFLKEKYVLNMIRTHYNICLNYFNNPKPFKEFDKELKKYDFFYNNKKIITKKIKLYRLSLGYFMYLERLKMFLISLKNKLKIIFKKIFFSFKRCL